MFIVFLRVLIIYVTVLVFLRLMGKRQIGEMQPYEVVITLIIADLATLPMSDTNIPLLNGILPLAILVLVLLMSKHIYLRMKSAQSADSVCLLCHLFDIFFYIV